MSTIFKPCDCKHIRRRRIAELWRKGNAAGRRSRVPTACINNSFEYAPSLASQVAGKLDKAMLLHCKSLWRPNEAMRRWQMGFLYGARYEYGRTLRDSMLSITLVTTPFTGPV